MTEIGPVNIQLTASGISEVLNAFKSVEDRAVALERKLDQVSKAGSRTRVKTAKDETSEKEKLSKQEVDNAEQAERKKEKASKSASDNIKREAKKQADEEIKESERSASARMRISKQLSGRIVNDFRSTLGHVTRIFSTLTALGGGLSIANAFSGEMKLSKSAMALEIASDVPGRPGQKINAAQATANARRMGLEYGVAPSDVLETQHAIIAKTGRGAESAALTEAAMRIGTAEGADPKELGQAIASAMAQNPKLTVTESINLMKMMVDQGKVGAIEVKDLAKVLPILTKTSAMYGGNQSDAQARLVTAVQTAIQTTGGPEQAAVAVSRFSESMASKKGASKMRAAGFEVFDSTGQLKPFDQLMSGYLAHGGGTAQGSSALGILDGRAKSLALAFQGLFQAALKEGKTKEEASELALKAYREELTMRITDARLDSDLKKVQSTDAFKVTQNMEKLNNAIGLNLVPHLIPLIEKFGKLTPMLGRFMDALGTFIDWASGKDWTTLVGMAAAASLSKAILTEVAASGLRSILTSAISGGAAGAAGAGGAGSIGLLGLLGRLGLLGLSAYGGVKLGEGIVNTATDNSNEDDMQVGSIIHGIKNGDSRAISAGKKYIEKQNKNKTFFGAREDLNNVVTEDWKSGNWMKAMADTVFGDARILTGTYNQGSQDNAAMIQKELDNTEATKKNTEALNKLSDSLNSETALEGTLKHFNRGFGGGLSGGKGSTGNY